MTTLVVYFKNLKAGTLTKESQSSFIFQYDTDYLSHADARQISVNLPLQTNAYRSRELFPFFDNLMAEGWLLDAQSSSLKIDRSDKFGLIAKCGLDCVGAVSLRGIDE